MTDIPEGMDTLKRPTRQHPQETLFDVEPDWRAAAWSVKERDGFRVSAPLTSHRLRV